jgi:hypothetical protein
MGTARNGIAPDASVLPCRATQFYDSEVVYFYGQLINRARNGETIVVTNSFGLNVGEAPPLVDRELIDKLDRGRLDRRAHRAVGCFTGREAMDVVAGSRVLSRPRADVRLRSHAGGRHAGVREVLASRLITRMNGTAVARDKGSEKEPAHDPCS